MALMTEERRKEMEEEMNRFELEISAPGKPVSNSSEGVISSKPLSPPPPPPAVGALIPEVLSKVPPPPPPPSSPPLHSILQAPPPPPPPPIIQTRSPQQTVRFIPHQLQRQPVRPPMRPNFIPMRGIPMNGPHGPFSTGPNIGPYMHPPMSQAHQMPPMAHGPMHMPPMGMPMPPQMGMMPPAFCSPGGPGLGPRSMPCEAPPHFIPRGMVQNFEASIPDPPSSEPSVESAPAVYAAPFVKSHESGSDGLSSTNGQDSSIVSSGMSLTPTKPEKQIYKQEDQHTTVGPVVPPVSASEEPIVPSKKKEKKKKTVRMAGGQAWEDNSLLEWDPDDFRIFCGDLGNDVTDEVLIRAFSKYPSFVKAKVIRDKRTNKTKGYGFVSFKDPQDFIKAMREMNGKYVGSRPIKLRKSTWRDRNIDIVKKKQREKEKLGLL